MYNHSSICWFLSFWKSESAMGHITFHLRKFNGTLYFVIVSLRLFCFARFNNSFGFCSIANMFRAIGRLIRARQELRIIKTSVQPLVKFQILSDVQYARAKLAANQAVNHSSNTGFGKEVKKSDVVTLSEEATMLESPVASLHIASGLNARMGWYCRKIFIVRGGQELRDLNSNQFELVTDEFGMKD
jgi:hypothetical protein